MLSVGKLREVVVVEEPIVSVSEIGDREQVWRPISSPSAGTYRAAIRQTGGSETERTGGMATNASFEVEMWPVRVDNTMRLRWQSRNNRLLYVASVVESEDRPVHLTLLCEEVQ